MRALVICSVALVLCGCRSSPVAPTPTSGTPAPAPSSTPPPASSADLTLSGHVTDVESGAPISGAVVSILEMLGGNGANLGLKGMTDATGYYAIQNIAPAETNYAATAGGYAERRTGFRIMANAVLDWQLRRVQPPRSFNITLNSSHICVGTTLGASPVMPLLDIPPPPPYNCQTLTFTMRRQGVVDIVLQWPTQKTNWEWRIDADFADFTQMLCRYCPNPSRLHRNDLYPGTYRFGVGVETSFGPTQITGTLDIQD